TRGAGRRQQLSAWRQQLHRQAGRFRAIRRGDPPARALLDAEQSATSTMTSHSGGSVPQEHPRPGARRLRALSCGSATSAPTEEEGMATPLNVLVVEDRPTDAELMVIELRREG